MLAIASQPLVWRAVVGLEQLQGVGRAQRANPKDRGMDHTPLTRWNPCRSVVDLLESADTEIRNFGSFLMRLVSEG